MNNLNNNNSNDRSKNNNQKSIIFVVEIMNYVIPNLT